jgi:hypothetical protein
MAALSDEDPTDNATDTDEEDSLANGSSTANIDTTAVLSSQHRYAGEGYLILVPEQFRSSSPVESNVNAIKRSRGKPETVDSSSEKRELIKASIFDAVLEQILLKLKQLMTPAAASKSYASSETLPAIIESLAMFLKSDEHRDSLMDDVNETIPLHRLSSARVSQYLTVFQLLMRYAKKECQGLRVAASLTKKGNLSQYLTTLLANYNVAGSTSLSSSSLDREDSTHMASIRCFMSRELSYLHHLLSQADHLVVLKSFVQERGQRSSGTKTMRSCQIFSRSLEELDNALQILCSSSAARSINQAHADLEKGMHAEQSPDKSRVYVCISMMKETIDLAVKYVSSLIQREAATKSSQNPIDSDEEDGKTEEAAAAIAYLPATTSTRRSKKRKMRSRNLVIDDWLDDENGSDNYADLEDFLVPDR